MFSATDDSDSEQPRRPLLRLEPHQPYRPVRRHKRFASSTDALGTTLGPLPEYDSPPLPAQSPPPQPIPTIAWQHHHQPDAVSPPPTYPGLTNRLHTGKPVPARRNYLGDFGDEDDDEDEEEERDIVPSPIPTIRARKVISRRRSVGGGSSSSTDDRLDSLLERSIAALEASNQLLQSSLSTHTSLAAVLADSASDRGMDVQIRYLAKRLGMQEDKDRPEGEGFDKVLEDVLGLLSEGGGEEGEGDKGASASNAGLLDAGYGAGAVSRSLPAEDHMVHLRSRSSSSTTDAQAGAAAVTAASQRRLRLSAGERPRSPPPRPFTQYVSIESPFGVASEATASERSIYMSSTSGTRTVPRATPLLPSASSSSTQSTPVKAPSSPSINSLPHHQSSPSTPKSGTAYTMLSQIVSRSSSASRSNSPDLVRTFGPAFLTSPTRMKAGGEVSEAVGRGRGLVPNRPTSGRNAIEVAIPRSASDTTWNHHSHSQSTSNDHDFVIPSPNHGHRQSASTATTSSSNLGTSSSMFDLRAPIDELAVANPRSLVGRRRAQVGDQPLAPSSYKVSASLRKILAESEKQTVPPVSEVAQGKQRAEGERPERRSRSASAHARPPALTISTSSATRPVITNEDGSLVEVDIQPSPAPPSDISLPSTDDAHIQQPLPPLPASAPSSPPATPRRSALKGTSGRNTPLSSGQSSPRVVTFSPLPPKHETNGSVGRAREKSKTRHVKANSKDGEEKRGWWTEWLLGASPAAADGRGRAFMPVHTRSGSMLREEGRWNGGVESWQV